MFAAFVGLVAYCAVATIVGIATGKCIKHRDSHAANELPSQVSWTVALCEVQDIQSGRLADKGIVLAHGSADTENPRSTRWQTRSATELIGPGYSPDAAAFVVWFQTRPDGPQYFVSARAVLNSSIGTLLDLAGFDDLDYSLVLTVEDGYVVPIMRPNTASIN
jgi:hypothetical protein